MNKFFNFKKAFSTPANRLLRIFLALFFAFSLFSLASCKKETDYFSYVSELRSNVLLCKTDEYSLRAYATTKEYPYATDGVAHESTTRLEIFLLANDTTKEYYIYFTVNGKEYGGDMTFDNVKSEYYYSCALDASALQELPVRIECGENKTQLTATSVRTPDTLTPKQALTHLKNAQSELFTSLTDKHGFAGEIQIRLIYEEHPYYYIGVINRSGKTTAYLMNANTGKLLAKREQ